MGFLNILRPDKETMQEKPNEVEKAPKQTRNEEAASSYNEGYTVPSVEREHLNMPMDSDIFSGSSTKVIICKPKAYENVELIGQAIKDKKIVILDLEKLDSALAKRILEFVYGVCFMDDIAIEKINDQKIFLIEPENKIKK